MTASPVINLAAWNTNGWTITTTASYKPGADSDNFFTNGKLYSAALLTLSQSSANALIGFSTKTASGVSIAGVLNVSPTISASPAQTVYQNDGNGATETK